MKTKHNPKKSRHAALQLVPVQFEFIHPTAKDVRIAGTFNHWHPEKKNLRATGTGVWWKNFDLAPGTYEYCFVVDGEWTPDPKAKESVPNPYGGRNSILRVFESAEEEHLVEAEKWPLTDTHEPATSY